MLDTKQIQDYLNRSGDDSLFEYGELEIKEGEGFCIWAVDENNLVLVQVYGNGKYWDSWATNKAKELNLNKIFFATKRNPQGFVRKYKYNIVGYILEREV